MTNKTSSESGLSDEQILNLGQMAAQAFNNPIFQIIHDKLTAQYFQQWRDIPVEHTKEMVHLKAKHIVLGEILNDMTGLIEHAERVYARIQHENNPETKENQRLDEQGYGLNFDQGAVS